VRCVRCDRPICGDCMVPASVGFQCPECVREGSRGARQATTSYGGRLRRPGPVTYALIGLNLVVFAITVIGAGSSHLGQAFLGGYQTSIFDDFALIPPAVAHGEAYRLVTAAFLHYGILHIAFNMWALYVVGPVVEAALGRWRYVAVYFLSGIGGSILTVAFASPASQSAGASGAIFGLFGALYVLQRRVGQSSVAILSTIVLNLIITFSIPNISWEGHVGGLITGTAVTLALTATIGSPQGRTQRHIAVIGGAAVLLAAFGFLAVNRVGSECSGATTNSLVFDYCQVYDPGSDQVPTGGNAAGGPGVVPSVYSSVTTSIGRSGTHA